MSNLPPAPAQITEKGLPGSRPGRCPAHDHQIDPVQLFLADPEALPNQPFQGIPPHGPTDPATNGQAEPRIFVTIWPGKDDKVSPHPFPSRPENLLELGRAFETGLSGELGAQRGRKARNPASIRSLGGQALAAFGPALLKDSPAALGCHAGPESVPPLPPNPARLECPLHGKTPVLGRARGRHLEKRVKILSNGEFCQFPSPSGRGPLPYNN